MAPTFVSGIPIYVQIADDIRAQILRGALRAGDQLTSTTEYSATYRINPATVGKAFAILVDEGLVEKRRGIGMFVAEGARRALVADGLASYVEETLNPAVEAGLALGLDLDAIIDLKDIDVVHTGMWDLASAYGHPGHAEHPDIAKLNGDAVRHIIDRTGVCCAYAEFPESVPDVIARGFRMINLGNEDEILARYFRECQKHVDAFNASLKK